MTERCASVDRPLFWSQPAGLDWNGIGIARKGGNAKLRFQSARACVPSMATQKAQVYKTRREGGKGLGRKPGCCASIDQSSIAKKRQLERTVWQHSELLQAETMDQTHMWCDSAITNRFCRCGWHKAGTALQYMPPHHHSRSGTPCLDNAPYRPSGQPSRP